MVIAFKIVAKPSPRGYGCSSRAHSAPPPMADEFFIFVATDAFTTAGRRMSAADLAEHRIRSMQWPLFRNTKHRKNIGPGDRALIYVGGAGRSAGHVIAVAKVQDVVPPKRSAPAVDPEDAATEPPHLIVRFSDVEWVHGV